MGKIIRISGPVVIAEDLSNAKMYDLVRVGEMGLVGEIIRLYRGTATIQVYEDTSGIRPGDKVENTGKPLSVQLGPGLLKAIYDGIQRPLDVLRIKTGDFISRGITAPPIDKDKYWEFMPIVKKGTEVIPGDIIGEVQETSLITHRIMIPEGVSGKVSDIYEGKFRVSDTVAIVLTNNGKEVPISMSQNWPVRVARKVIRKLPPHVPLITGQRVIDTFFPVAKGGTVAVPGPFGSGKCVTGDTKILLGDGQVVEINELYNRYRESGTTVHNNIEEIVSLDHEIELYSYVNSKLIKSSSLILYKGKSSTILKISTESGREVRITPVHKLFKFYDNKIVETMANTLKPGDYIAAIKKVVVNNEDKFLDLCKFQHYNISYNSLNITEKETSTNDNTMHHIPIKMDHKLAAFTGYFVATGDIREDTVEFNDRSEQVLADILALTKTLFGIAGKIAIHSNIKKLQVKSAILVDFIKRVIFDNVPGYHVIPTLVLQSSDKSVAAFLKAYFTVKATVADTDIELYADTRELQVQLSYALMRFGVIHKLKTRKKPFIIQIPNKDELKFLDAILSNRPSSALWTTSNLHRNNNAELSLLTEEFTSTSSEYIYPDKIISITEEHGPFDVYDVSVPEYEHNFVGGQGAILLHNTVVQHQLSKWADSDVVVYVGCGERGNEMTEILTTFPELKDPKSGKPLMERTVLIANTSNMPVAAREASIYTGVTIAEYYRDMGYNVALMADSTSRWAEALREISGRLEEMPGEEGYPAYLGRRLSEFYERSGNCYVLGSAKRLGSITIVGAVSPPGGDISEPVSQNTLRVTRVFWALDSALASRRHFPAINWLNSYSLYHDELREWYAENVGKNWDKLYSETMAILQKEAELQEVVQLVGYDALPEREKALLDIARVIKEDFLQQSAFDPVDTYCSMKKQYLMLSTIIELYTKQNDAVAKGINMKQLQALPVRVKISRMKEIKEEVFEQYYNEIMADITTQFKSIMEE